MNFITKKILEYQKKKLSEAENNLKNHLTNKESLKIKSAENYSKEIENEEKMIQIWTKNIEKIKHEIKKIQEKSA